MTSIVGNCAPLTIGTLDLISTLLYLGLLIYTLVHITSFVALPTVISAIYIFNIVFSGLAVVLAFLLLCTGVAIQNLRTAKGICIAWMIFRSIWLMLYISECVYSEWWHYPKKFAVALSYMFLWTISLIVVKSHTSRLSEAIRQQEIQGFQHMMQRRQMMGNKVAQQPQINQPPPLGYIYPQIISNYPPLTTHGRQHPPPAYT